MAPGHIVQAGDSYDLRGALRDDINAFEWQIPTFRRTNHSGQVMTNGQFTFDYQAVRLSN